MSGFAALRRRLPPPADTTRHTLSGTAVLVLAYALMAISGFVAWLIATQIISADEVGEASTVIASAMLVASLSGWGLHALMLVSAGGPRGRQVLRNGLLAVPPTVIAVWFLFVAGAGLWAPAVRDFLSRPEVIVTGLAGAIGVALSPIVLAAYVGAHRRRYAVVIAGLEAVVKIVGVTLGMTWLDAYGFVLGWACAGSLPLLVSLVVLVPRLPLGAAPSGLRVLLTGDAVRFSLAAWVADISWFSPTIGATGWLLPILVAGLHGTESAAYFYIAWSLAAAANAVPMSLSFIWTSHQVRTAVTRVEPRGLAFAAGVAVITAAGLAALASLLLSSFGANYRQEGTTLLILLSASVVPASINMVVSATWRAAQHTRRIAVAGLLGLTVAILTTVLLEGALDLEAAGLGWLLGQVVVLIFVTAPFVWLELRRRGLPPALPSAFPGELPQPQRAADAP